MFPVPASPKSLDCLLGFFAYYSKWIPNCSQLIQQISSDQKLLSNGNGLPSKAQTVIEEIQ